MKTEAINGYDLDNSIIIRNSTEASASGSGAGELFQYEITSPLTLPRQQAAMIPVVAQDIEAEKVSLYQEALRLNPANDNALELLRALGVEDQVGEQA